MRTPSAKSATRLDRWLVESKLVPSREAAAELISLGLVHVNGAIADKAARQVRAADEVLVVEGRRFVGRGGLKLEGALQLCEIDVTGYVCIDVGSSTGGFVDCLLQRGASMVLAVDVGTSQLDSSLKKSSSVVVYEETDIRNLVVEDAIASKISLITMDVSFISAAFLAPWIARLAGSAEALVLVKPQFEVGHKEASRAKGVIKDPSLWESSIYLVAKAYCESGFVPRAAFASYPKGTKGNREFFLYLGRSGGDRVSCSEAEIARLANRAVLEVS